MELHNQQYAPGSIRKKKRVGRGGKRGATSGRGNNGAQSRSGYKRPYGREGGQMPLQMRIPKMSALKPKTYHQPITLDLIQKLAEKTGEKVITRDFLLAQRVISKNKKYKILRGKSDFSLKGIKLSAHAFSKSASKAVEAQEGSLILI